MTEFFNSRSNSTDRSYLKPKHKPLWCWSGVLLCQLLYLRLHAYLKGSCKESVQKISNFLKRGGASAAFSERFPLVKQKPFTSTTKSKDNERSHLNTQFTVNVMTEGRHKVTDLKERRPSVLHCQRQRDIPAIWNLDVVVIIRESTSRI